MRGVSIMVANIFFNISAAIVRTMVCLGEFALFCWAIVTLAFSVLVMATFLA
jgi:hypothetical protein